MKAKITTTGQSASPLTAPRADTGLAHRAGVTLASLRKFAIAALATTIASVAATVNAGVNLEPTTPPGYSRPLTLFVSNGHILGAWAVGNKGNQAASSFEVGFYVNGTRTLVARINALPSGYMTYGVNAPFDSLPNGDSVVEIRVNDSRWVSEDSYADNIYSIRVTVNRGGGSGGGTPPAITRSEAGYQWPASLGYSSASRIISRATEQFNAQWTPVADFTNWRLSGSTGSYYKGTKYFGVLYSQSNPQTDVTGFLKYLPAMSGVLTSTTSAGEDCSGFISIAMELPSRQTTWSFDQASSYFTTVVQPGTLVRNAAKIQPGDAINSSSWGHVVLVVSAPVNGKVEVLEATADQGRNLNGTAQRWAVVKNTRSLSDLDANYCRVIRRSKLN